MPDSKSAGSQKGTWLGFDFGLRRTGVAVGQTTTGTATGLTVIRQGSGPRDWTPIMKIVDEWRPVGVVVGLPLDPDGAATEMSRAARRFGNRLAERTGLKVVFQDERLSSKVAEAEFADRRSHGNARRRDGDRLDAMAAAVILETWLQSQPHER